MIVGGVVIGGLTFGVGWGLLGYCPGTSLGAFGEGRWDSLLGIVGMLCGAALYAEAYPTMKATVLTWGDFGKITLPRFSGSITGSSFPCSYSADCTCSAGSRRRGCRPIAL